MLTLRATPFADVKREMKRVNRRIRFLNSEFDEAFIGMQDDSIHDATVPVYNFVQTLEILQKLYDCDEIAAQRLLLQISDECRMQGKLAPIFVTLLEPTKQVSVRDAVLDEYSSDPSVMQRLEACK